MRDRASSSSEDLDIVCAFFPQKIDDGCEEFDVSTVITRDANGPHVFLDGGTDDVGYRPMIAEINHFDPVPDKFQVDGVDRAIVAIANGYRGQNSNGRRHFFQELTTNLESRKTGKLTKLCFLPFCFLVLVYRFESAAVVSRILRRRFTHVSTKSVLAAIVSLLPNFLIS
jgi:hypothetical protein